MKSILLAHAEKYPMMEPTDAVKLLYQAAFGPGHMIADRDAALARTRTEMQSVTEVPKICGSAVPYEDIGGGYAVIEDYIEETKGAINND